jgi:hypothetical protein
MADGGPVAIRRWRGPVLGLALSSPTGRTWPGAANWARPRSPGTASVTGIAIEAAA